MTVLRGGVLAVLLALMAIDVPAACQPTKRHASVHRQFLILTGYPHGRPGWVVDHIIPLCACGPDTVENMQWQTARAAEIKDAKERQECRALRKGR